MAPEDSQHAGTETYDVVVVGAGVAGCAAALLAADNGASVLIVEKEPPATAGGNSRVSGNCWFASTSSNDAARYLRSLSSPDPLPDAVVEAWARETAINTDWLKGLGAPLALIPGTEAPEFADLDGADGYLGMFGINGLMGTSRLWEHLTHVVKARGIEIRYSTPMLELIRDADAVTGVVIGVDDHSARLHASGGVVLTTGGFAANADLVEQHLGVSRSAPWGSPANRGDGLLAATAAGADLWHLSNYMPMLGLTPADRATGFLLTSRRSGFVFVDREGQRFINEQPTEGGHGHLKIDGEYVLFPPPEVLVIFDHDTRAEGPLSPPATEAAYSWNTIVERYEWSTDNETEMDKGWIFRADSLAELGAKLGIPGSALEATVERYNASCAAGVDQDHGRPGATLTPITKAPFFGFRSAPLIGYTCGGPRRNERAEVLRPDGSSIPGLYCAGEVSSTYSWSMDGGMMIADAMAFGRIAGRQAAQRSHIGAPQ